jgi:hypothetical protein
MSIFDDFPKMKCPACGNEGYPVQRKAGGSAGAIAQVVDPVGIVSLARDISARLHCAKCDIVLESALTRGVDTAKKLGSKLSGFWPGTK